MPLGVPGKAEFQVMTREPGDLPSQRHLTLGAGSPKGCGSPFSVAREIALSSGNLR